MNVDVHYYSYLLNSVSHYLIGQIFAAGTPKACGALTASASAYTCDDPVWLFERVVVCWRSLGVNRASPRRDKTAPAFSSSHRTCPLFCPGMILWYISPSRKESWKKTRRRRCGSRESGGVSSVMSPKSFTRCWMHPFSHDPAIDRTIAFPIAFTFGSLLVA